MGKIVSEKRQIAKVEEKIGGRGDIPTQRKKKRLTIARFEEKVREYTTNSKKGL